jgi:Glycosyl transferase family 11
MKIISRQKSGLGNQLFQFAAGLYYARQYGAGLAMTVDPLRGQVSHGYARPFLLSHFNIRVQTRSETFSDRLAVNDRESLRPVAAAMRRALGIQVVRERIDQRYVFLGDLEIGKGIRTVYLTGYWQTHCIPDAIAGALRPQLQLRHPPEGRNLELMNQIAASRNPVSLHIRRGDYTLAAEGNIALPMSYYDRVIQLLRGRVDDPTFFVFSDDIGFAKANLPARLRTVFVDHNDDHTSHEDLRLMSACRHHIIANSSFSWWGAWLNQRPDKLVFAPKHWLLQPGSYYPDLFPPEWILIPV